MPIRLICLVVAFVYASSGLSKPLLENSQQTYAGACLDGDTSTWAQQAKVCEAALGDVGASIQQRLDIQVELAEALRGVEELARARTVLEDVIKQAPKHARALTELGWLAWDESDYPAAEDFFRRSLALEPSSRAMAGLASSGRNGDLLPLEDILNLLDAAIVFSPRYTWAYREKGWALIDVGRPEEAEDSFRAALEIAPDNPYSLYALGRALNDQDRYEEALPYLTRAVLNEDGPSRALEQRSLAWFFTGKYKAALEDAQAYLEHWPDSSTGYVRRARALSALGKREMAMSSLWSYLEDRRSGFVQYWLADLLYDEGNYGTALDVLNRTFEDGEADKHDKLLRVLLLLELEQYTEARDAVDVARAADPDTGWTWYYLALIEIGEDRFDAADATMEEALARDLPKDRFRYFLGTLAQRGQFVRMIQWNVRQSE